MKKLTSILFSICFIFSFQNLYSQLSASYVPLALGNMYYYRTDYYGAGGLQGSSYQTYTITTDTLIENVKYFRHPLFGNSYVRYDSLRNNFLIFEPGSNCDGYINQRKIDSLNVHLNDTILLCYGDSYKKCAVNEIKYTLGANTNNISFYNITSGVWGASITYAKGFGVLSMSSYWNHSGQVSILIGCKIYGKSYGTANSDTINAPYLPVTPFANCVYYSLSNPLKILKQGYGKDTIAYGRRFVNYSAEGGYVSFDTVKGNIIKLSANSCGDYNNMIKSDSIAASLNDTVRFCSNAPQKILTGEKDTMIFSRYSRIKTFKYLLSGRTLYKTFAKGLGLFRYDIINSENNIETFVLKGIQYQGIVKGDTSTLNFDFSQPQVSNMSYSFNENNINFSWTTNYEYNMNYIYLEKKDTVTNFYNIEKIIEAKGKYNNYSINYTASVQVNSFGKYYYRLRLPNQNATNYYSFSDVLLYTLPASIEMFQNYPNPFNGTTNIKFNLSNNAFVNLSLFDVSGRKVLEIVNQNMIPGYYSRLVSTNNLPSGIYFYILKAGDFKDMKKMVLVK